MIYFPSLIIIFQHLLQIRSLIENLPCELCVGDNPPVSIVLQGALTDVKQLAHITVVQRTSAAIATAAASKAKKTDLAFAVGTSLIFTVVMMVGLPLFIKAVGIDQLVGGAWIGGTVDSTGAVVLAGQTLGDLGGTVAALVKMIQNILIGFIAASLLFSFVLQPTLGVEQTGDIIKHLGQFKNWAFALAFTSIGLETNFKELGQKIEGGKPIALYIIGQLFNIALTYFVVWVLLSGRFFPIPSIQL